MHHLKKMLLPATLAVICALLLAGCAGVTAESDGNLQDWLDERDGTNAENMTWEQHVQQGDIMVRKGLYERAFVHYGRAQIKNPENMDIRLKKGLILQRRGLNEQAMGEYKAVLAKEPDNAQANLQAGKIYFGSGLMEQAQVYIQTAILNDPGLWEAHNIMGILYDREERYDLAEKSFRRAIATGRAMPETYNNLGITMLMTGRFDEAATMFAQAIRGGMNSPRVYNNLGVALARAGNIPDALNAFNSAGDEAKACNNLGYVLYAKGDYALAAEYFQKAIELSPSYYPTATENLKRARLALSFQPETAAAGQALPPEQPPVPQNFPPAPPAADIQPMSLMRPMGSVASPVIIKAAYAAPQPGRSMTATSAWAPAPQVEPKVVRPAPVKALPAAFTPVVPAPEKTQAPPAPEPPEQSRPERLPQKELYGLHVSSWRTLQKAVRVSRDIRRKGADAYVVRVVLDSGTWYRVFVGRFDNGKAARSQKNDLLARLALDKALVLRVELPTARFSETTV